MNRKLRSGNTEYEMSLRPPNKCSLQAARGIGLEFGEIRAKVIMQRPFCAGGNLNCAL